MPGENEDVKITRESAKDVIIRKFCLFCRQALTKSMATNEHVIAQWLLRQLRIGDRTIRLAGWQRGKQPSLRSHSWSRLVISDVCVNCNSGWLSGLENEVKPFLPPLATGQRPVGSLTDGENLLLARWAAKTAFLIQRTAGSARRKPLELLFGTVF
jgi:hypothetical protein